MFKIGDIVKLNEEGLKHYPDIIKEIDYFIIHEINKPIIIYGDVHYTFSLKPNKIIEMGTKYYITYPEYIDYHVLYYRKFKIEKLLNNYE